MEKLFNPLSAILLTALILGVSVYVVYRLADLRRDVKQLKCVMVPELFREVWELRRRLAEYADVKGAAPETIEAAISARTETSMPGSTVREDMAAMLARKGPPLRSSTARSDSAEPFVLEGGNGSAGGELPGDCLKQAMRGEEQTPVPDPPRRGSLAA